jgi:hypothetical protein
MEYCHGWFIFEWKFYLVLKWQQLQHCISIIQCLFLQKMTNNVRFTFSVDDTTNVVHNEYWARQIELVAPNTTSSVVLP